jgi:hypothetical protein
MNSDSIIVRVIVNGLAGLLLGALVMGLLGLILAGFDGMINGALLGGTLSLVGGFTSIAYVENAAWYKGVFSRYGKHRHSDLDEK